MQQNDTAIQPISAKPKTTTRKVKAVSKRDKFLVKKDSLLVKDSLLRVDSLRQADSLKVAVIKTPTGREGKPMPSTFQSESWIFPVILVLFFFLITSLNKSLGAFIDSFKNFFKVKESSLSAPSINFLEYKSYSTLFFLGVISLLAFKIFDQGNTVEFYTFLKFFGVTVAFYIIKILLIEFIGHVFFDVKIIRSYKNIYFDLLTAISFLFFILIIIAIYKPINVQIPVIEISLILLVIFHILLLIKLFQIFYGKLIDTFYIFLYLCTLEILPLIGLFLVYSFLI